MLSVRGIYQDSVVRLSRPIAARDGEDVSIECQSEYCYRE